MFLPSPPCRPKGAKKKIGRAKAGGEASCRLSRGLFFFRSRAAYFFAPLSMDCKKKVTARSLNSMLPQADIFVILTSVTEHAFPHGNFLKNVYLDKLSIGGIYHSVSRRFNTLTKILPRLINSDNAVKSSSGNTASVSKSLAW